MAVPMLNFAQLPVTQPRSEMADFSNALLQAGAMRQQRMKEQQARADQMAQQQFQNDIATQQLGIQKGQFGLAQEASAREAEQFGLTKEAHQQQMKLGGQTLKMNEMDLQDKEDEQAVNMALAAPGVQQALQAAGNDPLKQLEIVQQAMTSTGTIKPRHVVELMNQRMNLLKAKSELETDELKRASYQADIGLARAKTLAARADEKAAGMMAPSEAQKIAKMYADDAQGIEQRITTYDGRLTDAKKAVAAATAGSLETAVAALPRDNEANAAAAAEFEKQIAALGGMDSAQAAKAKAEMKSRLAKEITNKVIRPLASTIKDLQGFALEGRSRASMYLRMGGLMGMPGAPEPLAPTPAPSPFQQAMGEARGVVQEVGQQAQQLFGMLAGNVRRQQYNANQQGKLDNARKVMENIAAATATDKPVVRPSVATPAPSPFTFQGTPKGGVGVAY